MASKKNLVIVESPSKAKTIGKFLGSRYKVVASVGHVRDLPKSRMGVDVENNFEPEYINVRGKAAVIREIKNEAQASDKVFLATDPDREGEAISWHICTLLGIKPEDANRIEFHEITKDAVTRAVSNPRPLNMALVDAQQGRRVIDRVVGYGISPVLWKKVSKGLSAGRVQSAALKIIVDREALIDAFDPQEYWALSADLSTNPAKSRNTFTAKLEKYNGKKIILPDEKHKASVPDKKTADAIYKALCDGEYTVKSVEKKETSSKPYAPYTTSVLQQDASVRLNFPPRKTMMIAQQLYEGIQVKGHGNLGLITYMRTDSVRVNPQADAACKALIGEKYGKEYVGPGIFSNKKQNTQDAHEAIRPSNVNLIPDEIRSSLNDDQYKLYKLIWDRFVASRMVPAVYDSVGVDISCGKCELRATGRTLKFDGFFKVYTAGNEEKSKALPAMEEGQKLSLITVNSEQKFTEPPSRFTEASLIKELEDLGIGRPSTYAPIVTTLSERRYITKEKKALVPTGLGKLVTNEVMEKYFPEISDVEFTSKMEEDLDNVAEGKINWKNAVADYYEGHLRKEIADATEQMEKIRPEDDITDEICPQCGRHLAKKRGKYGEFLACTGYPECKYTQNIVQTTGVKCPSCGSDIIARRSKRGKLFYGCSGYPACQQVYWYMPVQKQCPACGALLVDRGNRLECSNQECTYKENKE